MGIFKHLGDAFSGKIYKQNTLVGSNIAKLLEKSQKLPNSKFIKHWAFACILSCDVSLSHLLFEKEGEEINAFKRNIGKLNESKVFEIIKLLTGHYLSAFKRNDGNIDFLKKANMNIKKLEEEVFSTFFLLVKMKKFLEILTKNLIKIRQNIFCTYIKKYLREHTKCRTKKMPLVLC